VPFEAGEVPDPDEPDEPDPADPVDVPEDPEPWDEDDPSPDDPASFPPSDDEPRDAFVPEEAAPRSFFAQPEPLKWIVGGANCLRSVCSAPHVGQNSGAGSLSPWRMSVFVPQLEQTYS
jgi:hypothetical protein